MGDIVIRLDLTVSTAPDRLGVALDPIEIKAAGHMTMRFLVGLSELLDWVELRTSLLKAIVEIHQPVQVANELLLIPLFFLSLFSLSAGTSPLALASVAISFLRFNHSRFKN